MHIGKSFAASLVILAFASFAAFAGEAKLHRVSIQVDQNDPAVMNLALNNAMNIVSDFRGRHEDVRIEIVAYGPGLHMFRADTSPVKERLKRIKEAGFPSPIVLSACANTKRHMEKAEGHPIDIVPEAHLVSSGAVRLMELQEQGWAYLKP